MDKKKPSGIYREFILRYILDHYDVKSVTCLRPHFYILCHNVLYTVKNSQGLNSRSLRSETLDIS